METGFNDAVASQVNVIAFIDRLYSGAKTYQISHDSSPSTITSTILTTGFPPEPNMGLQSTLQNFITYCFTNFPAEKYVLDLWDHGGGIFGICWDDSNGNDKLTFDEVDAAIAAACSAAGETIDILAMDACLMQMLEVDYEMREYVDYIVASEETIPGDGFPYDTMISSLCGNPSQSAYTYAIDMVNDYYNSYSSWTDLTLSAVNVQPSSINPLMDAFNLFTAACIEQINTYGQASALASARAATQEFYYDIFVDLYDFAKEAKARISHTYFDHVCDLLMGNITSAVINNKQRNNPDAKGISIYFPDNAGDYESAYATVIDLGEETDWDVFLTAFYYGPTYQLSLYNYDFNDSMAIDPVNNDADDIMEQGETINVTITIKNTGTEVATNVNGTLTCTDGNVTVLVDFQVYGTIPAGSSTVRDFQFNISASAPNNLAITFDLRINATFSNPYSKLFAFQVLINASSVVSGGASFDTAVLIVSGTYDSSMPGPDPSDSSEWFKFSVISGDSIQISIDNANPGTDFDAYLYSPAGSLIAYAIGTSYPDTCLHTASSTGYYRLRIKPYSGTGAYQFTLTVSSTPGPSTEDGYSFGTAITFTQDENLIANSLPSAGPDGSLYYRIFLQAGEHVVARLDGDSNQHDFDLYLYDSAINLVDESYTYYYPERVSGVALNAGYFYIVVSQYSGSGSFTLQVTRGEVGGSIGSESSTVISLTLALIFVVGLVFLKRKNLKLPLFFN